MFILFEAEVSLCGVFSDGNDCDSSPCLNNGTCQDLYGEFNCYCPSGFTGKMCQTGEYLTLYRKHFILEMIETMKKNPIIYNSYSNFTRLLSMACLLSLSHKKV